MPSPAPDAGAEASAAAEQTFRLDLAPEPSMIVTARLFASGIARLAGCDEPRVEEIKLAVSEACTVALEPPVERITLRVARTPSTLTFAVAPAAVASAGASGIDGVPLPTGMRLIGLVFDDAGPAELDGKPAIGFTVPLGAPPSTEA
jgi:hypothetical protein